MSTFTDEQVMRPEAQELIPKIEMKRTPGYEGHTSWAEPLNVVEIHLKDGRVLTEQAERDNVGALRGATFDAVRTKYLDCARLALTSDNANKTLHMLDNVEDLGPVGPLASLLGG